MDLKVGGDIVWGVRKKVWNACRHANRKHNLWHPYSKNRRLGGNRNEEER
jgi:hypothetical protein